MVDLIVDVHIYLMYYFCIGTSCHVTEYNINNLIIDSAAHVPYIYTRKSSDTKRDRVRLFFVADGYKKNQSIH
jgi:hypothetical protein